MEPGSRFGVSQKLCPEVAPQVVALCELQLGLADCLGRFVRADDQCQERRWRRVADLDGFELQQIKTDKNSPSMLR